MFSILEIVDDKSTYCRAVLEDLPEWFGLPEALDAYVEESTVLPMFAAFAGVRCVGVLTLKRTTIRNFDIHVMGVLRSHHRNGIGRKLVQRAILHAQEKDCDTLSVKTLGPSHPDPHYAATRTFYDSLGFVPIEEFKTLWSNGYPCLLMVKFLG